VGRAVMDYVGKALAELRVTSLQQIQVETAQVWCGRSLAAHMLGLTADAIEYGHEAIEHAALSGDDRLLSAIRSSLFAQGILP